jgi:phage terminase large subunit-like protein
MKKVIAMMSGVGLSLVLVSAATASSFEDSMSRCLSKNANTRDSAVVMLDCNADAGKLSGCKVVSESVPGKGFDKAALCVADVLPIGSRTGQVKVPLRFPGGG